MNLDELLSELTRSTGVSGTEYGASQIIYRFFTEGEGKTWVTNVHRDRLGNLILEKKGKSDNSPKIMFAAHVDEIGLAVTDIDDGFLRFSSVGGIDPRVLLSQEVVVHAKRELPGVIAAKPPHLQDPDERKKAVKMEDMVIDIGMKNDRAKEYVNVGDFVSIRRDMQHLVNSFYSAKAMDDRAGVVALVECLRRLSDINHECSAYCVVTVQEEVGLRGALVGAYGVNPDIGIAIDVSHGSMPGLAEYEASDLGKGPVIDIGPHVHPKLFDRLKDIAKDAGIGYQIEASPYPGGTDTYAIQIARDGVPTALISIPLRYMHTSVETLSMDDVRNVGRLLASLVAGVNSKFVEGLKCF